MLYVHSVVLILSQPRQKYLFKKLSIKVTHQTCMTAAIKQKVITHKGNPTVIMSRDKTNRKHMTRMTHTSLRAVRSSFLHLCIR